MTKDDNKVLIAVSAGVILGLEIVLARIFSVKFFPSLAFFVISSAMLGLSASSIYFFLKRHQISKNPNFLASQLLLGGLAMVLALILLVNFHFTSNVQLVAIYISWIPAFFFTGNVLVYLLFHKTEKFGILYFCDLLGAAAICLVLGLLLETIGAPSIVVLFALLLTVWAFKMVSTAQKPLRSSAAMLSAMYLILLSLNLAFGVLEPMFSKGTDADLQTTFYKWNTISRVASYDRGGAPWNQSLAYEGAAEKSIYLDIDSSASTTILHGNQSFDFLKYDLAQAVYSIVEPGRALVIGAGGGRDVQAALSHGMQHVTAVELNAIIFQDLMLGKFKEYSGGLYADNKSVLAVSDEGRSFVRRSKSRYDVVQISLVDTWAATAAGAFVNSENTLYTVEAFKDYLLHLSDRGAISVLRWSGPEIYRLLGVFAEAAIQTGIASPQDHVLVLQSAENTGHVANAVLFTKTPIQNLNTEKIKAYLERTKFKVAYPDLFGQGVDPKISHLLTNRGWKHLHDWEGLDLSPVTDNRPFFFYTAPANYWGALINNPSLITNPEYKVVMLGILSLLVAVFVVIVPLLFRKHVHAQHRSDGFVAAGFYFSSLGIGFMLVEMAMIQKFAMILGHPSYSLTCSLAGILIGAGLGSFTFEKSKFLQTSRASMFVASIFVAGLSLFTLAVYPHLFEQSAAWPFFAKVLAIEALIVPLGFALGMFLPWGMLQIQNDDSMRTWAWALNGVFSVAGTAIGTFANIKYGFWSTMIAGSILYLSLGVFGFFWRRPALEFRTEQTRPPTAANTQTDELTRTA